MTKEAMYSNSTRNLIEIGMDQVKEIILQLDRAAANSIILDEAVGLKRVNYCYVDVAAKRVKYIVDKKYFHPREELVESLSRIIEDPTESPFVELSDRNILAQIAQSPKVSVTNTIRNAFSNLTLRNQVDDRYINLNSEGKDLLTEQPLYAIKKHCSLEICPKCGGAKVVSHPDKHGEPHEASCTECQGTGSKASFGYVSIQVDDLSERYVLCLTEGITYLKDAAIISHVLEHSMERYRTLTKFNEHDDQDYDATLRPYVERLHDVMGCTPATEDLYYQIVPCVEFAYRDILTGKICHGAIIDVIDNPELILNLTSKSSKVSTAMKDTAKGIGNFFGTISRSDKHKAKNDLKRTTRLLIATTIADGKVDVNEKALLLNELRDMSEFTSSEQDEFVALMGSEDITFLTDDDFDFYDKGRAQETLVRMRQIAEADGCASQEELDLLSKMEHCLQ